MVTHTCNPCTQKTEAGGFEFEAGLHRVVSSCFKTTMTIKDRHGVLSHDHSTWGLRHKHKFEVNVGYTVSSRPVSAVQ